MRLAAFDSGIGGLSAVAPLFKLFPDLDLVYLGDLANLPYGIKSPDRIRFLVEKNVERLVSREIQANRKPDHFIVACNTASAHALDVSRSILGQHGVSVSGVLDPACRSGIALHPRRIVVLATPSTVSSHAYEARLKDLGFQGPVSQKACPLFVPLVEDNFVSGPAVETIIRRYLDPLSLQQGDAVILGCTHYPFLLPALSKIYPNVAWVEAGKALADSSEVKSLSPTSPSQGSRLRLLFTDSSFNKEGIDFLLKQLGLQNLPVSIETLKPID